MRPSRNITLFFKVAFPPCRGSLKFFFLHKKVETKKSTKYGQFLDGEHSLPPEVTKVKRRSDVT
ncbi:MAG: hypothetical protein D6713_01565 [Deltaproteobacteria bacterium]|nr:MAG: hypothetical protein D6713_01565 [Deltaproteobacteria bacterium]